MKRSRLLLAALTLPFAYACASRPDGGVVSPPPPKETSLTTAPIAASSEPPQSYTPEAKPKPRTTAITQRWMSRIGKTDHRTTMAFWGKDILVGARGGSGIHVLDGKSGNTWEEGLSYMLDHHDSVAAFVKNDHLGFEIPYVHEGRSYTYVPDFLVRLVTEPDGVERTVTSLAQVKMRN